MRKMLLTLSLVFGILALSYTNLSFTHTANGEFQTAEIRVGA